MKDCIAKQYGCSCEGDKCRIDQGQPVTRDWYGIALEAIAIGLLVLAVFGAGYLGLSRVERACEIEARV